MSDEKPFATAAMTAAATAAGPRSERQAASFPRPLPKLDGDAAPFWRALAEGAIELPRCRACRRYIFYPRSFCPRCSSREVAWERIDGRGRVYTFTVVHKPTNPYFMASAPYVYALVELDCGVRLPTMLVQCRPGDVKIGDPVEPVFEKVNDQVTLLYFRPRAAVGSVPQSGPGQGPRSS